MPRVTPCRVLKVLAWPWFVMIGLYFFLPSPIIPPHQREAYIQNKLASGNTVITALDYMPFQKESHSMCYDCTDVLIHWRLINFGHDVLLSLSDYDTYGAVNLTNAMSRAREWNEEHWETGSDRKWTPYFSLPVTLKGVPGGNIEEEVNMPWFHTVDRKLIQYNMHNVHASIVVRVVVPEPGIAQIWRGAYAEWALNSTAESQGSIGGEVPQVSFQQTAYKEMMLYKQETDFLASFHLVESWENTLVVMEHLAGDLPSRTYPIRRALLVPLGPFLAIPFILAAALYDFMSPFVWFIAVWLGILVGLVGYRKMLESGNTPSFGGLCWPLQLIQRLRKRKRRNTKHVWGPTGPVVLHANNSLFDEEREIGIRRPGTVRLDKR